MRMAPISWIVRFLIFCFWILVIGLFLLIPTVANHFKQEKSLTIFTWPLLIDPIYLKKFEQETGIKLYISYFDNSAALLNKMIATNGRGYDLVIPDDRSLELLIAHGLIKKIDHSKLDFWAKLNPVLLGNYADRANEYSIPYYWGVYGIGYDQNLIKGEITPSWEILFNPTLCVNTRLCMTDEPREAIMIAAQYLFGSIEALKDKAAQEQVKQLLIAQKKYVEVYTISRSDSLLQSKSCGFAAIMSPDLWRLSREFPHIKMVIPAPSSFAIIDSFALCAATRKQDLIYTFLNYLYRPEVLTHHMQNFGFCSPLEHTFLPGQEEFCPMDRFASFEFFRNIISDDEINQIWIEVLAA